jgi:hypothetical protein
VSDTHIEDTEGPEARRRKLYMTARDIGLSRDQRLELAEYVLRRDIATWKNLSDEQVTVLLNGLECYLLVTFLLARDGRADLATIRAEEAEHRRAGKDASRL